MESDWECDLKAVVVIGGKETGSTMGPGSGVLRLMGSFEAEKEGEGVGVGVESMATENPGMVTAVGTEEDCTCTGGRGGSFLVLWV